LPPVIIRVSSSETRIKGYIVRTRT
jgi:hypothetical protein